MLKPMKITHFNHPEDTSAEDDLQTAPSPIQDQTNLSGLYPHAKTIEEQLQDEHERAARIAAHQPKHSAFKVAVSGAIVLGATLLFARNIQSLWMDFDGSIPLIFLSFVIVMILVGALFAWIKFANTMLYAEMTKAYPFWIITIGAVVAELFLNISSKIHSSPGSDIYVSAILLFAVLYVTQKLITIK